MADEYSPSEPLDADFDFNRPGYQPSPPLAADFNFAVSIYRILKGFSNVFTAIWADSDAGRTNGKMYTLSWGPGTALTVLDLSNKTVYDYYTQSYGGRAEETLTNTDTRDLNVDTP